MKARRKNAKRLLEKQLDSEEDSRGNGDVSFDTQKLKEFMKVNNSEPNKREFT